MICALTASPLDYKDCTTCYCLVNPKKVRPVFNCASLCALWVCASVSAGVSLCLLSASWEHCVFHSEPSLSNWESTCLPV